MMKSFKYFLFSTFLLLTTFGYTQKREGSLTYEMVENAKSRKQIKGRYQSYIAKDGSVINIGDKVTIGKPSSNKTFAFIISILAMAPAGVGITGFTYEIKNIFVDGANDVGFTVFMLTKKGMIQIAYEQAVAFGEIVSDVMSSDQALAELRKQKDKLDLEIISQAEYDSIKAVLIKYIK